MENHHVLKFGKPLFLRAISHGELLVITRGYSAPLPPTGSNMKKKRLPLRIKVLEDLHGFGLILLLGEAGNVLCLNTYHVYSDSKDCYM